MTLQQKHEKQLGKQAGRDRSPDRSHKEFNRGGEGNNEPGVLIIAAS